MVCVNFTGFILNHPNHQDLKLPYLDQDLLNSNLCLNKIATIVCKANYISVVNKSSEKISKDELSFKTYSREKNHNVV